MRSIESNVAMLIATALSVAVGGQSDGAMAEGHKMDMKDVTYAGPPAVGHDEGW